MNHILVERTDNDLFILGSLTIRYTFSMIRKILIASVLATGLVLPAHAQTARELDQDELRQNVEAGRSLALAKILEMISKSVDGDPVDVRAFDVDGIVYRILLMMPGGKLASVVVDAATGKFLPANSSRVKVVSKAAKKKAKSNNGKSGSQGNKGGNGKGGGNDKGKGGGKGKK